MEPQIVTANSIRHILTRPDGFEENEKGYHNIDRAQNEKEMLTARRLLEEINNLYATVALSPQGTPVGQKKLAAIRIKAVPTRNMTIPTITVRRIRWLRSYSIRSASASAREIT